MENQVPRLISVSGNASVEKAPDTAIIKIVAEFAAKTQAQAQIGQSKMMANVMSLLEPVPTHQIRSGGFQTYPAYEWNNIKKKNLKIGYTARQTLTISTTIELASKIIGQLADYDVQTSLSLGLKNQKEEELEALKLAFADARRRAKALADASDVRLATVYYCDDASTSVSHGYHGAKMMSLEGAVGAGQCDTGPIIPEGVITINATVNASFSFVI
jgi:uncharacterized protein YggE